jgi:cysteine desulfurase
VDDARDRLAAILGVRAQEIIFTGGGTEACNLGVIGLAMAHTSKGRHIITSSIEHHAVLHACEFLQKNHGFDVTVLPVDRDGIVHPERVAGAIRPDTTLVSIMHANNETGVIQPLAEMADICNGRGVVFHTDAVQTFGKMRVRPVETGISALSISAHKFHGPMGVGALCVGAAFPLAPTSYGGSHENTRRPGTENVAGIVGMAVAAEVAVAHAAADAQRLATLRESLWTGLHAACPGAVRNGCPRHSLPNTLNVSFPGTDGEALLIALDLEGVCASGGSACMVGSVRPSHVLLAMGVPEESARAAVRFSLGHASSEEDIFHTVAAMRRAVELQSAGSTQ